jgi:pSer/pThr/pTyr-binding forkhead associated (FHA) protein
MDDDGDGSTFSSRSGSGLARRAPGGGTEGRSFRRTTTDPRSDALRGEIFLDDVTVSRRHAELVRDGDTLDSRPRGLNGTYVNRRRIESTVLETTTRCRSASTV